MPATERALVLVAVLVALTGCFVRKRVVFAPGSHPNQPPLTATKEQLIHRIHEASDPIESFLVRVDMSPSTGGPSKGVVTDYATLPGYIVYQRSDDLRVIVQDPVMSSTIFDMVSTGREFRLYIPSKQRFIIGDNGAPPRSKNELENLRPSTFLTALMVDPPDSEKDITILEDDTNETKAVYILLVIRRVGDDYRLVRNIYFDRYTLQISRQKTFDASGRIASETNYSNWKGYGHASFPSDIDIKRPQENYEVELNVISMKMNPPNVAADRFVLEQPQGTELHVLR
jgi:hypothetical protein